MFEGFGTSPLTFYDMVVRDYGAISYQFTPTFFTSHEPSQITETRMHYTMCWQPVSVCIFTPFLVSLNQYNHYKESSCLL